jgi:hypothetical protein
MVDGYRELLLITKKCHCRTRGLHESLITKKVTAVPEVYMRA